MKGFLRKITSAMGMLAAAGAGASGPELPAFSSVACCDISQIPVWLKPILARIHPEVSPRYYGCGLVCPPLLDGCRVLDLGCGAGRDVYALAQLVGPEGEVVGFDILRFMHGCIERLEDLDLEPSSFDVIVSNCVVNLSPDKDAVLAGVQQLLKQGGEFFFSDVYANRRVPLAARTGNLRFFSATYRLFKLDGLESGAGIFAADL